MTEQPASSHRAMCYRCHKPQQHCLCELISSIDNATNVLILQHPNERFHPLGTARLAKLALKNSHLEVAWNGFCDQENIEGLLRPGAGILYPSDDASDLESLDPAELPKQLVVLDGTWHTAKQIYRDNPVLQRLPKFSLQPIRPSLYRIRKAPKPDQRSTIEAIWQARKHLEPNNKELDKLLVPFEHMIDRQVVYQDKPRPRSRNKRSGQTARKPLHASLTEKYDSLVVGYGEFIPAPDHPLNYQLLVWAAHKPSSGETFIQALRPAGEHAVTPSAEHLEHMGITLEMLNNGLDREEFQRAWHSFAGSDYVLGTWNEITHRLFRNMIQDGSQSLQLKRVYCSLKGDSCGPLHKVAERHNCEIPDLGISNRAGLRLNNAVAVTGYLRAQGIERLKELGDIV